MIPRVDNAAAHMLSFRGCLIAVRGLLNVDGKLLVGPVSVTMSAQAPLLNGGLEDGRSDELGMLKAAHSRHLVEDECAAGDRSR